MVAPRELLVRFRSEARPGAWWARTFERLWPTMAAAYSRIFTGIPDEERHAFVATLNKMLKNVRVHEF